MNRRLEATKGPGLGVSSATCLLWPWPRPGRALACFGAAFGVVLFCTVSSVVETALKGDYKDNEILFFMLNRQGCQSRKYRSRERRTSRPRKAGRECGRADQGEHENVKSLATANYWLGFSLVPYCLLVRL